MTTTSARRAAAVCLLLVVPMLSVLGLGPAASATNTSYWVDATAAACSDAGSGTQAAPFCSISAAAKKAVGPGDTVHVAPGQYREQVTVAGSGASGAPITFVGDAPGVVVLGSQALDGAARWTASSTSAWTTPYAPPSAPRQVFLDDARLAAATSATTTTANSWFYDATAKLLYVDIGGPNPGDGHSVDAGAQSFGVTMTGRHDVVVSNIDFRRQNFAGARVQTSSAVTLDQVAAGWSASNGILVDTCTSGVVVRGATVDHSLSTGIRLTGTTGATVSGSTSHDNGLHGIGLATSPGNTLSGNTTYGNVSLNPNATANGIDVDTSSPDNVVSGNLSHDNQDSGIQVYSSSHRTVVARNISWSNGDHGFDTLSSTDVRYVNNTAWGNRRDGISVEGNSLRATLANNVLVDNGAATNEYDLYVDASSAPGFSGDHDLAWNSTTTPATKFNGTVYRTIGALASATSQETHGLGIDPGLLDPAHGDFRLTPGTAAVDSGDADAVGFTGTDQAGNPLVDDPLVADAGTGTPTYADRGALEQQPPAGATDYAPHAALVLGPPTVQVPPATTVTADASGSSDADATGITSYTFDFGDGTTVGPQPAPTATHAYRSLGTFHATVTVTDDAGQQSSAGADEVVTQRLLQTYYVTGSSALCTDSGTGSQAIPFCTIGAATKKAQAGDTVLVGAGTYREQLSVTTGGGEQGAPLTVHATTPNAVILGSDDLSGTAGWTATTTTAWQHAFAPSATPTQVWLDGQPLAMASSATTTTSGTWFYDGVAKLLYVDVGGANPGAGHSVEAGARNFGILVRGVSNVDISGFTVGRTDLSSVYLDTTSQVSLSDLTVSQAGAHGVTVDSSTQTAVRGVTSSGNLSIGVRFFNTSDSSLRGSTTHDNQFHGVSVQGSQRVTIAGNTSYANKRPGSRVAAGIDVSAGSSNVVVEGNTSRNNDDSGFESNTAATGTTFRRNVSYDNGDHGIDVSASTAPTVVSNTVVGNATAGINLEGGSTNGLLRDNVTRDNAVGSTRTIGEIRIDETSAPGASLDRDLVSNGSGGALFEWASQPYTTLAGFQAVSTQEPHGIAADPRFADLAGRNLHLTSSSPAIDAAFTSLAAWSPSDRDGVAPVDDPAVADTGTGPDAVADLGAYEYVGPAARATLTPAAGPAPLTVALDGTGSVALGAPITSYAWTCGNGTSASGVTATCRYPSTGTFTVVLKVTDGSGLTDTWSGTVKATTETAPAVTLTATPATAYVPQDVVLDACGSTVTDGTPIASYSFVWGNGQSSGSQAGATYTCSYPTAGTFTASVTVRDTAGLATTRTVHVKINPDTPPTAQLSVSPTSPTRNAPVRLDASGSTSVDKSPIATFRFSCGNGVTSGEQVGTTYTCSYAQAGSYTVQVWATDTVGLVGTRTAKFKVR